jgi:hypothetical protein
MDHRRSLHQPAAQNKLICGRTSLSFEAARLCTRWYACVRRTRETRIYRKTGNLRAGSRAAKWQKNCPSFRTSSPSARLWQAVRAIPELGRDRNAVWPRRAAAGEPSATEVVWKPDYPTGLSAMSGPDAEPLAGGWYERDPCNIVCRARPVHSPNRRIASICLFGLIRFGETCHDSNSLSGGA